MIARTAGLLVVTATAVLAMAFAPATAHADDIPQSRPDAAAADRDSVQDVMFLSETRPIFIRLRLDAGRQGVPDFLARRGRNPSMPTSTAMETAR